MEGLLNDEDLFNYDKTKKQKLALKQQLEKANQELNDLRQNISNIEGKIMNRETDLRQHIMHLSERTHNRDINLIKDNMKALGQEINLGIKLSYASNRNILKERKKDINLKNSILFKNSNMENSMRLSKIVNDHSKYQNFCQNVTMKNDRIKSNYNFVKEKCDLYREVQVSMKELILRKKQENDEIFDKVRLIMTMVESLKSKIASEKELREQNDDKKEVIMDSLKQKSSEASDSIAGGSPIDDKSKRDKDRLNTAKVEKMIKDKVEQRRINKVYAALTNMLEYHKKNNEALKAEKNRVKSNQYFDIIMSEIQSLKKSQILEQNFSEMVKSGNSIEEMANRTSYVINKPQLPEIEDKAAYKTTGNIQGKQANPKNNDDLVLKYSYISKDDRCKLINSIVHNPVIKAIFKANKI